MTADSSGRVHLTRDELVALVGVLFVAGTKDEEDDSAILGLIRRAVSYPNVSDLIFYPPTELSVEEVVDRLLAHRPVELN